MKRKKLWSCIILSIFLLLAIGCVLDSSGFFSSYLSKYEESKLKEELKSINTVKTENTKPASSPSALQKPDTNTGASANPSTSKSDKFAEDKDVSEINLLSSQSIVSVIQSDKKNAQDLTYEDIRIMVRDAVSLAGGFKDIIKDGQVVVLKPNLVQIHSDITGKRFVREVNGITTDWRVAKAVAELVREYNPTGKVYIMEGSAGDRTREAYEYLNYTHEMISGIDGFIALEESSGAWQEFASPYLVRVDLPSGLLHKSYYLNKLYKEADILISIPCLKNNSGTVVTGGIKNVSIGATPANIYGLSPKSLSRTAMVSHSFSKSDLHRWIHDYYLCKPVDFVIMDGLQGFQNGPAPYKRDSEVNDIMNMRLIIAGKDAVAVDTVEALVTGWDPLSAKYLRYLNASSMGNIDTKKITVLGKYVDVVRKFFKTKYKNSGGSAIKDTTPPDMEIKKFSVLDNKLCLEIFTGRESIKSEVYIDDKLEAIITDYGQASLNKDISMLDNGSHMLRIITYDRYLNHNEKNTSFIK
ncbi:MAG: DUF362 domain-containing protein [Clostridia bacterium]|nr:DUF362 domain-containing protein [Clostridia bacterium]